MLPRVSTTLGPYELLEPLGKGGNGEVWRARHVELDTLVAVKIDLHPPDPASAAAFLHEVAIIAALDHPHVARIVEHGIVPRPTGIPAEGAPREGSRWLAMELAGGGSLLSMPPTGWKEILFVMRGLLLALAHSHARGVIHRDVKPANLLLAGPEVGIVTRPARLTEARVVLSDFGISERREVPSTNTEDAVGTPHYMAPEQIEARWRDQGPWTDLYAAGVLLWRLTTGAYPYEGKNAFAIYRGHVMGPIPTPALRPGVPHELAPILRRCLAKNPAERFGFAVDLLRALEGLGGGGAMPRVELAEQPTERASTPIDSRAPTLGAGARPAGTDQAGGLSLFGLRRPPLVGRSEACDVLWGALARTRAEGRARVVLLRGPQGVGRTRLVRWVCEQAHEQGLAEHLVAEHLPGRAPGEALRQMLRKELRTDGLDATERLERVRRLAPSPRLDHVVLAGVLGGSVRLSRRDERVLMLTAVEALAMVQPRVLALDDVHHDIEALELVDHLLAFQHRTPTPLLVVVTLQDTTLAEAHQELLEELSGDPAVTSVALGPLDPVARQQLIRSLVGLDAAVAARLEDRTEGNPQFAVELVRAWIESGVLVLGPRGYALAPSGEKVLPADLEAVWTQRVERVLGARSEVDQLAVEAAACLGAQLPRAAWEEVVGLLEITPSADLLPALVRSGLVHTEDAGAGWRFAHRLVRDVLEARARAAGRWVDVNLAAAIHLQQAGVHAPARLAHHLLEAGVDDQAVEPLFEALHEAFERGDTRDVSLLEALRGAFDRLELPRVHPWRGRLLMLEIALARKRFAFDRALELLVQAQRTDFGAEVRALGLREGARVQIARNRPELAQPFAEGAIDAFRAIGDGMRAADAERTLGEILVARGELDAGRERLEASVARMRADGWDEFLHLGLYALARLEQRTGRTARALAWLDQTRENAEQLGLQLMLANCANLEGELARAAGDPERAAACYALAAERHEAMDNAVWVYPVLNLGVLDVLAGRFDVAAGRMDRLLVHFRRAPQPIAETFAHVVRAAASAGRRDLPAAAASLGRVEDDLAARPVVDGDLALMAEATSVGLYRHGAFELSDRALELAVDQYRRLGRIDDVRRLEDA